MSISGKLIGGPFIASIDFNGNRANKSECAYVVKNYLVPRGYTAYILDSSFPKEYALNLSTYFPDASVLYGLESCDIFHDYDIIEVSETGIIHYLYNDCTEDTVIFITNKCNSNCIMCPDSDSNRKHNIGYRKHYLEKLIDLLPSDVNHITITGGEPTLLKWDFIDILSKCKDKFENTEFLLLSNGRSFSDNEYRNAFLKVIPSMFRIGVPIYADNPIDHDAITRAPGSFNQTISALLHLQYILETEIRIVVMRNTYKELPNIARFLTEKLPHIYTVSLMGMEILGNAAIHRDELWIDFADTVHYIEEAVQILLSAGIEAKIYNYPLCSLPHKLWSIAAKSISNYKVTYQPECESCEVKSLCGGFFNSTMHAEKISVYPIKENKSDTK